jgi:hydroxyacylglutathione hydrolase
MVEIIRLVVGSLRSNCYVIHDESECVVIDPGDDAEYIKDTIAKLDVNPTKILATHGHFDHILAALELQLTYKIPFYINKKDIFLLNNMARSVRKYLGVEPLPPPIVDSELTENKKLVLGKSTFSVIETPGHTPGSICLYSKIDNILICGDLIFDGGAVGRTDFSYSNNVIQNESIGKIVKLPANTKVYSGHGDEFLLSSFISKWSV